MPPEPLEPRPPFADPSALSPPRRHGCTATCKLPGSPHPTHTAAARPCSPHTPPGPLLALSQPHSPPAPQSQTPHRARPPLSPSRHHRLSCLLRLSSTLAPLTSSSSRPFPALPSLVSHSETPLPSPPLPSHCLTGGLQQHVVRLHAQRRRQGLGASHRVLVALRGGRWGAAAAAGGWRQRVTSIGRVQVSQRAGGGGSHS